MWALSSLPYDDADAIEALPEPEKPEQIRNRRQSAVVLPSKLPVRTGFLYPRSDSN